MVGQRIHPRRVRQRQAGRVAALEVQRKFWPAATVWPGMAAKVGAASTGTPKALLNTEVVETL